MEKNNAKGQSQEEGTIETTNGCGQKERRGVRIKQCHKNQGKRITQQEGNGSPINAAEI